MPRAQESPISRMLRFFRDSSLEVAEIGLDLAGDAVKARKFKVAEVNRAVQATTPAPVATPVAPKPAAKAKPATKAPAKAQAKKATAKPGVVAPLSRAEILERARAAKAAKTAKPKTGADKRAAAVAANKPKARKPAPATAVAHDEAPHSAHLPPQSHPVEGDLGFVDDQVPLGEPDPAALEVLSELD